MRVFGVPGLMALAFSLAWAGHVEAAGVLRFGRNADSEFLDPVLNDANVDIWILTNLYSGLLVPDPNGTGVKPGLATEWHASNDGKTFTVKLRPGVKFADGSPVTTDDVVWSLNRARDPKAGIWNFLLGSITQITAQGSDTVVFTLKNPDPTLPAALATFNAAILPHKLFEAAKGATDDEKAKDFALHPVGAGPFMLTSWQRDSRMVVKRNPNYWNKDEAGTQLPYLDEIDFTIVPDDATRILQLKAGQIDATEFIPYERVKELQADPKLTTDLFASTQVTYLNVNVAPKLNDGTPNPLSDQRVRQALNYAINKKALIQITTHGLGTPMRSFMASTTPLYADLGPAYPYDLQKAKSLLQAAGFSQGFSLAALAQAGKADDTAELAAVQQMWAPLGVKLSIQQLENATLDDRYHKSDFQIRTNYWTNDINDPSEIASYFAYYPNNKCQFGNWQDKEVDKLFEQSQIEQNPTKRAAQYRELQQRYMAAAPIFFLYESPFAAAQLKSVTGYKQIPLGNYYFERTKIAQ